MAIDSFMCAWSKNMSKNHDGFCVRVQYIDYTGNPKTAGNQNGAKSNYEDRNENTAVSPFLYGLGLGNVSLGAVDWNLYWLATIYEYVYTPI